MLIATQFPVNGIEITTVDVSSSQRCLAVAESSNPFANLVSLYKSNKILLAELTSLLKKSASARAYLDSTGCNPVLGGAQLVRLRVRRSAVLALLRANRIRARALLSHVENPAVLA